MAAVELRQVTLCLPADTLLPVPHGRWRRLDDGAILATYGPEELELALLLGKEAVRCRKAREAGQVSDSAWKGAVDTLLLLLAPTAPHLTEELWQRTGHDYSIHNQGWPKWDEALAKEEEITLVIQVNGKLRDRITVPVSITEDEARALAMDSQKVKAYLGDRKVASAIYIPGRLVNLVVR
jgi:leucyl-tRNA synthetase